MNQSITFKQNEKINQVNRKREKIKSIERIIKNREKLKTLIAKSAF